MSLYEIRLSGYTTFRRCTRCKKIHRIGYHCDDRDGMLMRYCIAQTIGLQANKIPLIHSAVARRVNKILKLSKSENRQTNTKRVKLNKTTRKTQGKHKQAFKNKKYWKKKKRKHKETPHRRENTRKKTLAAIFADSNMEMHHLNKRTVETIVHQRLVATDWWCLYGFRSSCALIRPTIRPTSSSKQRDDHRNPWV